MRIGTICVFLLSVTSPSAFADQRDLSLRVGLTHSSVDGQVPAEYPQSYDRFDFTDGGLKLVFEAPLTEQLGVEFGWTEFGTERAGILQTQHATAAWTALTRRTSNGPWTFAGKIGAARATLDLRYSPLEFLGEKVASTEVLIGASIAYHINDRFSTRLSLDQVGDIATTFGIELDYHWRVNDPTPTKDLGFELTVGTASTEGVINTLRYSESATQDVVVSMWDQPTSSHALGLRIPYRPWLSFEFVHFPTASTTGFSGGIHDPPIEFPPGSPGPPPPPGPVFTATSDVAANLLVARFEYAMTPELDLFVSAGALTVREVVTLTDNFTDALIHRETESETNAWIGAGLRYRVFKALSVTVEHGWSSGNGRSRAMLGWSF